MGAQAARFIDATPREPCPACGSAGFCTRARDGRTIICRREAHWDGKPGKHGTDRLGDRWVYTVGIGVVRPVAAPLAASVEPAPIADRHRVYSVLLDALPLEDRHLRALCAPYPAGRGMPRAAAKSAGYGTLGKRRWEAARILLEAFGPDMLARIPGMRFKTTDEGGYWTIGGRPGLLIPVRDVAGRVSGIQLRADDPVEPGDRYRWLSSSSVGGPGAPMSCHVPLGCSGFTIRLTEGPLKGDAATFLDPERVPTVAVPGVGTWRCAVPVLGALRATAVRIAFDADWRTNPRVAAALEDCASHLAVLGYEVEREDWDGPKGIDDLLASGGTPRVTPWGAHG